MMEEEQKEHVAKLNKMEREMEEVFERKVREKKQKLSDNERDLERRQNESTTRLQQLKKELEVNLRTPNNVLCTIALGFTGKYSCFLGEKGSI